MVEWASHAFVLPEDKREPARAARGAGEARAAARRGRRRARPLALPRGRRVHGGRPESCRGDVPRAAHGPRDAPAPRALAGGLFRTTRRPSGVGDARRVTARQLGGEEHGQGIREASRWWSRARRAASGWASRAPSRREGANVMLNGLGEPAAIEAARAGSSSEFGVKALLPRRRHDEARRDRRPGAHGGEGVRRGRHPGEQRRHPARRAGGRVPDREVGRDHRDQPVLGLPRDARGAARA